MVILYLIYMLVGSEDVFVVLFGCSFGYAFGSAVVLTVKMTGFITPDFTLTLLLIVTIYSVTGSCKVYKVLEKYNVES